MSVHNRSRIRVRAEVGGGVGIGVSRMCPTTVTRRNTLRPDKGFMRSTYYFYTRLQSHTESM